MSHDHLPHSHNQAITSLNKAFIGGIALNIAFVLAEFGAGFYYNSLALMSDAGHNLSDVVSLVLALVAFRLAKVKPNPKYTYGYKKSTVLVSLLNAVILLVVVGGIIWESIHKLQQPAEVQGGAIAWVAGIGVLVNGFTAFLFVRHKDKDLNVRGAYLHMAADALVSVGVLLAGLVIHATGWYVVDPLIGIAVAVVILVSTWNLLRDSLRLSLDGVPAGLNVEEIGKALSGIQGVKDIHHIHVWAISTTENALTAHVVIDDPDAMDDIKHKIRRELEHFGVTHSTLEFEMQGSECGPQCG